jgi:hypothetical protein
LLQKYYATSAKKCLGTIELPQQRQLQPGGHTTLEQSKDNLKCSEVKRAQNLKSITKGSIVRMAAKDDCLLDEVDLLRMEAYPSAKCLAAAAPSMGNELFGQHIQEK